MDGFDNREPAAAPRARSRSPAREREIRDTRSSYRDDAPPPRRDDRDDRGGYGGRDDRRGPAAPSSYRGPRNQPPAKPNNVVGVFGLSLNTQERDLEDEFGKSGRVEKVTIVYDQRSQRSRGFGFVVMRDVADAQRAIEDLNGVDLHGRRIRVDFSTTSTPHKPTPGQYMGTLEDAPPRRDDDRRPRYESSRSRYDERDRYADRPPRDDYDRRRRDESPPRRRRTPSPRRDRSPPPRRVDDLPPRESASRYPDERPRY